MHFKDDHTLIDHFACYFLVHCPKCNEMANVSWSPTETTIRATCSNCGFLKDWHCKIPGARMYTHDAEKYQQGVVAIGAGRDWNFHYPLWLSINCCGHELWAYNSEHLEWLKNYVSANLRESTKSNEYGWCNASLASRLPKWLKSVKNKKGILKAIRKLEQKLLNRDREPL